MLRSGLLLVTFIHTGCGLALAEAPQTRPVVVTPLLSTGKTASGQPIVLPPNPAHVHASRFVIAPGAKLPVHKHPHPRYAYVKSGTLAVYDADTGKRYDYKPGDFIIEVLDQWHYGENTGTDPVELIVVDQVPEGHDGNTVLRPAADKK
jgi:quercetin dioxygenase-like cupin family protein